jgi:hypothetical protein
MGCYGCEQRRILAQRAMEAARQRDMSGVRQAMGQMAKTAVDDVKQLAPRFRVKPEIAKMYHLDDRSRKG